LLMCVCGVLDATLHEQDDYTRLDSWIERLTKLLDAHPEGLTADAEARVIRSLLMAFIMRRPGGAEFRRWLERGRASFEVLDNPDLKVSLGALLAVAAMWSGGFGAAGELLTALATIERDAKLGVPAVAVLRNVESMYWMLRGERAPCLDAVRAGLELYASQGVTVWGNQLLANAVGACLAEADLEGADEWLQRLEAWPVSRSRTDRCRVHYFSGWRAQKRICEFEYWPSWRLIGEARKIAFIVLASSTTPLENSENSGCRSHSRPKTPKSTPPSFNHRNTS